MRILICASYGYSLTNFRGDLIKEIVSKGHEVICTSIEPIEMMEEEIKALGASYYCIPGSRTGTGILKNIKELMAYIKAFKHLKPDCCFLYMSKPIIYGGIAAILSKVANIFVFVTGLEVVFYSNGLKNRLIRKFLKVSYGFIHDKAKKVFFMNQDDLSQMEKWHIVKKEKAVLVNGSGVNLEKFKKEAMPSRDKICMTARLVKSKGIKEYVDAAKLVKEKHPEIEFLLVGDLDENPEALSREELAEIINEGNIKYMGFRENVKPYLKECSIFVLPSYHEGNGRSIVEAEAMGRPIITTDAPGCKDTVIPGFNGFLVPTKNSKAIAEKIEVLLSNPKLKSNMAENSYILCKERFDVKNINTVILDNMNL